jgi:hypothetical protein
VSDRVRIVLSTRPGKEENYVALLIDGKEVAKSGGYVDSVTAYHEMLTWAAESFAAVRDVANEKKKAGEAFSELGALHKKQMDKLMRERDEARYEICSYGTGRDRLFKDETPADRFKHNARTRGWEYLFYPGELKCYSNDVETYVAKSPEDATAAWEEATGEKREDYSDEELEWDEIPAFAVLRINTEECGYEEQNIVEKTAREWAKSNGRGFLCSTEC